ncbi:MAG: pyridoxamine 5'-phosphate oxidase family protein [Spirochaetales bacterium]|nr:pyridoxamine 5'-phosphate oxidase family protein [Spirochaetales bacterium]
MNKEQIFEFLNENGVAALATTDGERPYLRNVWTIKSDEKGILFHTSKMKDMFTQLMKNKNAEMCFLNEDKSVQIRVSGKARLIEDVTIKNDIVSKRPFLKEIEKQQGSLDFLAVFLLEHCIATVWTMESILAPKEYITLS